MPKNEGDLLAEMRLREIEELHAELAQLRKACGGLLTAFLRAERNEDEIGRATRALLQALGLPTRESE